MQEKILKQIEKHAISRGLEMIVNKDYDNVLTVLFQPKNDFETLLEARLSFQTTYLTGTVKKTCGLPVDVGRKDYNDSSQMMEFFRYFFRGNGDKA